MLLMHSFSLIDWINNKSFEYPKLKLTFNVLMILQQLISSETR